MGIYSDLQSDLKEAFDDDLFDAVEVLTIKDVQQGAYDPVTGLTSDTILTYKTRCIVLMDEVEEENDTPIQTDQLKLLVLDSEKKIEEFKTGLVLTVRGSEYELVYVKTDSAKATHVLYCKKLR